MYNPSLREEPRNKPASIVSTRQQISILDWLDSTGRLIPRETDVSFEYEDNTEELQELMVGDDNSYDDDDDDATTDDDED